MRELTADGAVEERNYASKPLTAEELESILDAAGSVEAVLNVRNKTVRERGWKHDPPDRATFVRETVKDNNLIRRPILITDDSVVVGKDEDALRAALS